MKEYTAIFTESDGRVWMMTGIEARTFDGAYAYAKADITPQTIHIQLIVKGDRK